MTPTRVDKRIFVVGVPRSGTTLVQSLLAAHEDVTSFPESHFFSRYFSLVPPSRAILTRNPLPRVREFLLETSRWPRQHSDPAPLAARELEDNIGEAHRIALPRQSRSVARQLLALLDELALERNKRVWIEKTPMHLHYLSFLESCIEDQCEAPRTDFVHVIREGLPTVASLFRASSQWELSYDLPQCVRRWNQDMARSLARSSSPRDHFVFYEELTASPCAAARRLFDSLGLDWQPEVLDRYAESSRPLITAEETWKAGLERQIEPSQGTEGFLTEEQRALARLELRDGLYTRLRERVGSDS